MSITYFPLHDKKNTNYLFELPPKLKPYLSAFLYAATQPNRSCKFRMDRLAFERFKRQAEKEVYGSAEEEWWCSKDKVWRVIETKVDVIERWWWLVLGENVNVGLQLTEEGAGIIQKVLASQFSCTSASNSVHSSASHA